MSWWLRVRVACGSGETMMKEEGCGAAAGASAAGSPLSELTYWLNAAEVNKRARPLQTSPIQLADFPRFTLMAQHTRP